MKRLLLTPYVNAALKLLNAFPINVRRPHQSRVRLHWGESESDVAPRWGHRKSNLMFTLRSDKDSLSLLLSLSVFELCENVGLFVNVLTTFLVL